MKILINATNLHTGGGVQVAASFIDELYKLVILGNYSLNEITVACSDTVISNISVPAGFFGIKIINFNVYGFKSPSRSELEEIFYGYDVMFTIFGPCYFTTDVNRSIVGFAQPWIAYPDNIVYSMLPKLNMVLLRAKYWLQRIYFNRADIIVVEHDHVKEALVKNVGFIAAKIEVVENCVSSALKVDNSSKTLQLPDSIQSIKIGFLGRNYFHKNLAILKEVSQLLLERYNLSVSFVFTLTHEEMSSLGFNKLDGFHSVGAIKTQQCSEFYSFVDFIIFPSLLECYSATPVESLKMGVPLLASKLPFVTKITKECATYFDPTVPSSIADAIHYGVSNPIEIAKKVECGKRLVQSLPNAVDRAKSYMNIILQE